MTASTAIRKKEWSEAELQALPDNGFIHEVINGELAMSPKNNFQHENICSRLFFALETFNRAHGLGVVFWIQCRLLDVQPQLPGA